MHRYLVYNLVDFRSRYYHHPMKFAMFLLIPSYMCDSNSNPRPAPKKLALKSC